MTRHFQAGILKAASSWGCIADVPKMKLSGRIQKIGKMTDDFGSRSGRLESARTGPRNVMNKGGSNELMRSRVTYRQRYLRSNVGSG